MSKKSAQKPQPAAKTVAQETVSIAGRFGYEEMLSELEAIVADAEVRLAEEEIAA